MARARTRKVDSYTRLRLKMMRETELALLIAAKFPQRIKRIPTIEVGRGTFHATDAAKFWQEALELTDEELSLLEHQLQRDDPLE